MNTVSETPPGILAWGTYDTGKPRVRILLRGLREHGIEVAECHRAVWSGVEDKSQIKGVGARLRLLGRWLGAYPALAWCFLRRPRADVVLIPYLGQLDILLLWPFAKARGSRLVFDAFLSLYNTVVEDRRLVGRHNPIAWLLYAWEWLACHAADIVLVDTDAHGDYFRTTFGLDPARIQRVLVGVEPERFPPAPAHASRAAPLRVLFYGQFIPLHGIETVVRAAKLTEADNIHWHLIGTGQEAARIEVLVATLRPANLTWTPWVPYDQLITEIHAADCCLGIFGATDKAARVIPNKVFQVLAADRPIITRDGPAARELTAFAPAVRLIPPADPPALAAAVRALRQRPTDGERFTDAPEDLIHNAIGPAAVVAPLVARLRASRGGEPPGAGSQREPPACV